MPRIAVPPQVIFQEMDGETVLLDLESSYYFGLDEVGTRVWQLVAEHGDTESVLAAMVGEYDVDEARLRREVGDLFQALAAKGLVTIEPPA